ncbi:MAG: SurA N-terminal domain-containing protein [Clostridia bacterium]|nr:SurA N-terminal domain-containing protein [Clostridia bacterium]
MKKKFLTIIAFCLTICFLFAGCNLISTNKGKDLSRTAITVNGSVITKEDVTAAYNTYINSYYNQYGEEAFDELIDDLISQKLVVLKAEELIASGEIVLTNTEKNYMASEAFDALLSNLEKYEQTAKEILEIEEETTTEPETDAQFVYEEYEPYANVVFNEETGKYEIKLAIKKLIAKDVDGKTEYEYVTENEYATYQEPTTVLTFADFEYEKLNSEDAEEKAVAKQAKTLYLQSLLKNEEGKNLSTDEASVFEREYERIYQIIYKNFLSSKLYQHTIKNLNITEEEVLNLYLEKVVETHDRYEEDEKTFQTELIKSVQQANQLGRYGTPTKSIKDVLYVPENGRSTEAPTTNTQTTAQTYFTVYHIFVKFSDEAIERLKEAYELGRADDNMTNFNQVLAEEKANLRLNERDENGTIVVKAYNEDSSINENALTFAQMAAELNTELAGATTAAEKGDIFRKYLYKYTTDKGLLQIQYDYFGNEIADENWYGYVVGTAYAGGSWGQDDETNTYKFTSGYVDEFVAQARALYNNGAGEIGDVSEVFYMESIPEVEQKDEDGNTVKDDNGKAVKVKEFNYGGFDIMMFGGVVENTFENFNNNDFDVDNLPANALKVLSDKRLGITGNKTLFDLIYEEIYEEAYSNTIKELKEELKNSATIVKNESVYNELNPFK